MKVYIPETIPSQNKGEEAILQGIYQGLKNQNPEVQISIFSKNPAVDSVSYDGKFLAVSGITFAPAHGQSLFRKIMESITIWMKHLTFLVLWRLFGKKCLYLFRDENWRAYSEADIILVGHDGLFSDLNIPFALFVKGMHKKAVIFGCGITEKFRFKLTEKIAPSILSKMNLITVREKWSQDYLRSIGVPASKVYFKPDPAFIMKVARQTEIHEFFKLERLLDRKGLLIGMVVVKGTAYFNKFHEHIADKEDRYQKHIEFFAELVETVVEITSGTVLFLPHCIQPSYDERDDRICARDVKAKMKRFHDQVLLIENEYSAAVLKGVIQRLDFLISERLHAIIGSASVGTPFIMLAAKQDTRSVDIVVHTIGREDLLFYLNDPKISAFSEKFEHLWKSRKSVREDLIKRAEHIHTDCQEAARLLADVCAEPFALASEIEGPITDSENSQSLQV